MKKKAATRTKQLQSIDDVRLENLRRRGGRRADTPLARALQSMEGAFKVLPTQVRRRFFSAIIGADFIVAFESNISRKAELMWCMDDRTVTVYILQARATVR